MNLDRVGAYFAKSCSEKILKENFPAEYGDVQRAANSAFAQTLAASGERYERHILSLLTRACAEQFVAIEGCVPSESGLAEKEEATFAAVMSSDVTVVFNPRIGRHFEALLCVHRGEPIRDLDPLRVSEPDILIRLDSGWAAADVKDHAAYKESGGKRRLAFSQLSAPSKVGPWEDVASTLEAADWLQLAHYYRHLQALDLACGEPLGAVLGRSESPLLVWARLDVQGRTKPLEIYDRQFAERLTIRELATRLNANSAHDAKTPTAGRPEHPGWFSDCKVCEWREVCKRELDDLDHLSLLPQMGRDAEQKALRLGLPTTRAGLAALPFDEVVAKGWTGVKNVSAYWAARARAEGRMILRDDEAAPEIPYYDIEVDFDLENSLQAWSQSGDDLRLEDSRLYMYSIVVTNRNAAGDRTSADSFQFDRYGNTNEDELAVFLDTWNFCQDLIRACERDGKSLRFFHYTQPEISWPRKLARKYAGERGVPTLDEVEQFFTYLSDLSKLATRGRAWPTAGVGLKHLAKFTGYSWKSDEASGDQSTVWFSTASNPDSGTKARYEALTNLKTYGMDDVWAQLHLREWLANRPLP